MKNKCNEENVAKSFAKICTTTTTTTNTTTTTTIVGPAALSLRPRSSTVHGLNNCPNGNLKLLLGKLLGKLLLYFIDKCSNRNTIKKSLLLLFDLLNVKIKEVQKMVCRRILRLVLFERLFIGRFCL